ncbi:hypothetical protein LOTGIDRAFT_232077 [Lottia gigantea]|uniref:Apple domain-containing protein n=1 Tax=Lottia gigantea TaxID=225164 RepID=V4AEW4_LOTGI|nr:hypothetical protein LOTGIDRAFT_232077 [Lottia gigantea]ESO95402.1 hypothetical protein LOTGIDRAFT_232077 [Lottia gigantea]
MATAAVFSVHCILILIFSVLEHVDSYCFHLTDNMRSFSGLAHTSVTTVSDCTMLCSDDQSCKGVTWHKDLGCYIVAQMENRHIDNAFLLEHFTNCSSPAHADMTVCFHHRGIGTSVLLNGMVVAKDCFTVCRIVPTCLACNWDISYHKCYLFYQTSTGIAYDVNFHFYNKHSSCSMETTTAQSSTSEDISTVTDIITTEENSLEDTGATSEEAPEVTSVDSTITTNINTAADTTTEVTTADIAAHTNITWSDKEGYFIYENGYKENNLVIKNSRIYCATQCVKDILCNGFDYNSTTLSCHLKTNDFQYRRIQ